MRKYLLGIICLFIATHGNAQNLHERIWYFGNGMALQFNNNIAVKAGIPDPPPPLPFLYTTRGGAAQASTAMSNEYGELQFFVHVRSVISGQQARDYTYKAFKVFDRDGNPFPNGNIETNYNTGGSGSDIKPLVLPFPGMRDKYVLIYSNKHKLMYSIIDMQLNNGMGDVDIQQKDIPLTTYGVIESDKTILLQGCNEKVWLITRSRIANEYLSFEITSHGIIDRPVISTVGTLPLSDYRHLKNFGGGGILKASNNGKHIAAATNGGIELYDFEPCSGRLKNARIIDTLPAYGLCFSPDDSKLYASHNKPFLIYFQGEVFQYDLSSANPDAISASRNLVVRNPIYYARTGTGGLSYTGPLGELKIGLDGKIYVSKNNPYELRSLGSNACGLYSTYLNDPVNGVCPLPPNPDCIAGQYMHVIHEPDQPGMACNPELDYLKLNDDYRVPGLLLQSDIRVAPAKAPDTITGIKSNITVCFRKEETLIAAEDKACYTWDDGSTGPTRTVKESGTYWVSYFKDCSHQTDSFQVVFIHLPKVPRLAYGCPGEIELEIKKTDSTVMVYTLQKEDGEPPHGAESGHGHVFKGLSSGEYTLRIQSPGGCDTTLRIRLEDYPLPEVIAHPADTVIRYGDSLRLGAEGAQSYLWFPPSAVDRPDAATPSSRPLQATRYFVVGTNEYGCRDTAYINVDIDYTMPDFMPNAFSPNGDGINDLFRVEGITYQRILAFQVFNRFGQLVFQTTDPAKGWDGNYNGKPCEVGTYYYLLRLAYPELSKTEVSRKLKANHNRVK